MGRGRNVAELLTLNILIFVLYFSVWMFLLSLSNGAGAVYSMMFTNHLVKSGEMQEGGTFMVLSLQFGLLVGSVMSFGVVKVATGSW